MPTNYGGDSYGSFIWVSSEQEALNYPVARNSGILMMHRTEPVIYMKSADAYGRQLPLEIYDLTRRQPPVAAGYSSEESYVKEKDFESRVAEIVKAKFDELMK